MGYFFDKLRNVILATHKASVVWSYISRL